MCCPFVKYERRIQSEARGIEFGYKSERSIIAAAEGLRKRRFEIAQGKVYCKIGGYYQVPGHERISAIRTVIAAHLR